MWFSFIKVHALGERNLLSQAEGRFLAITSLPQTDLNGVYAPLCPEREKHLPKEEQRCKK